MGKNKKTRQQQKTKFIIAIIFLFSILGFRDTLAVDQLTDETKTGKIILHHIDQFDNKEISTNVLEGKIGEVVYPSALRSNEYSAVQLPEARVYKIEEEEQNLYYYYLYNCRIEIYHIDETTGSTFSSTGITGREGQKLKIKPETMGGKYILTRGPECEELTYTKQTQKVYFYYRRMGQVVVHYMNSETMEEMENETIDELEGTIVKTKPKDIEGYTLVEQPYTDEYEVKRKVTDVYYYYLPISQGVSVKYIDIMSNSVLDTDFIEGYNGKEYTALQKEFPNYTFVKCSNNTSGKMGKDLIEVEFYYIFNSKIRIHHIYGTSGGEDIEEKYGYEGDKIEIYPKSNPIGYDGKIYTLNTEKNSNKVTIFLAKHNDDFYYYYIPKTGNITVKYVDKATGEYLKDPLYVSGDLGDKYKIEKIEFPDYLLVYEPENYYYTFDETSNEVIFYYLRKCFVTVNYIDQKTGKIIETEIINGLETEKYSVLPKNLKYYTINETDTLNREGIFTKEPTTINYYYNQLCFNIGIKHLIEKVIVDGNVINQNSIFGKIEVDSKRNSHNIQIYYKIIVSNNMDISGSAMIKDYIPYGFEVISENWQANGNEAELWIEDLKPGETREYILVLENFDDNIMGLCDNKITIGNFVNEPDFEDFCIEDNITKSNLLIGIKTGEESNYLDEIIAIVVIFLLICIVGNNV